MAAIEKIRSHSGLLIAIIGIALLAFVLQDLFQSQGRNREFNVAVVDGEKIPYQDYEIKKEKNLENRRSSSNNNLSSAETYSIYNSTLEEMIKEHIMTKEYEASGIGVTSDELYDQFMGDEPHQWVVQSFSNADGSFNKEMVEYYLQNLNDFPADARVRWIDFERAVKENRLETKFQNLVKASYSTIRTSRLRLNSSPCAIPPSPTRPWSSLTRTTRPSTRRTNTATRLTKDATSTMSCSKSSLQRKTVRMH